MQAFAALRPDFCNICGAEMSQSQIGAHQREAHSDFLERRQQEYSRALGTAALIYVPSGVAFFLLLFVPDVILGMSEPGWYVGVVFIGFMVSVFAPLPYAARKRRAYVQAVGDILERCPVCDAKIPSLKRQAHLESEHSREAKRFKALTILAYGSFLGIFLGVIAVLSGAIVGILPFGWGDLAHTLMFVLLAAWGAVFIPWGFLVERPHRAKVRAEWQATHFTLQTRPR